MTLEATTPQPSAEERAEAAERLCVVQAAALHKLCDYIERELIRTRRAAQMLASAPDIVDRETAFARVHEVSTVAYVVTQIATLVENPAHLAGWVPPAHAQKVHQAFLSCFQQLQDQQAMSDERGFEEYRAALALLGHSPRT